MACQAKNVISDPVCLLAVTLLWQFFRRLDIAAGPLSTIPIKWRLFFYIKYCVQTRENWYHCFPMMMCKHFFFSAFGKKKLHQVGLSKLGVSNLPAEIILFTSPYSPHLSSRDLINQLMPLLARPNFLLFSCNGHARKAIAKLWFAAVTLFNLSKILTTRFIYLREENHQRDWKLFFYGAKGKKCLLHDTYFTAHF